MGGVSKCRDQIARGRRFRHREWGNDGNGGGRGAGGGDRLFLSFVLATL